jgi:uncharacterized protein YecE (DUF72 family)
LFAADKINAGEDWEDGEGELSKIKYIQNRDVDVYLIVNNHYEGCAPMTIEKIKKTSV